jgi:nitrite reductase (NADH) large subunit
VDLSNDADQTLVIIGNGMVSHRLCQRMVEYNAVDDKRIVVFGDEPRPAYDRVHLTDLLSGTSSTKLLLASADWYAHNGIELFLDDPVVEIDRVNGVVHSKSGQAIPYTRLVFATGAQPFVPEVEVISPGGEALPGVYVYRTVDDVYDIEDRADELLGTPFMQAAVIGGGILGLEAAKAIYDLGLNVHVIEAAPWLMPRQLDADGAAVLREKIERLDVKVHCGRQLKEVEALPFDVQGSAKLTGLRLTFDTGDPLMVGMLVFAAGVRPRGELAAAVGLSTSDNGGIIVDARLQAIDRETGQVDEQIHAIGDCAAPRGSAYGLVLPGYQMVDVLASNLVGGQQSFETPDVSVRLKLMGVTVAALGEYDGDKLLGTNAHVFNGGGLYRKLVVRNGRLIGAVTIGDWENLDRIRDLLKSSLPLSFWDMRRFRGTGDLWAKSESSPVADWAPEAVICGCLRVTRGAIGQLIAEGCTGLDDVCARTKAGTLCGSCKPLIAELLGVEGPASMLGNEAVSSQSADAPMSRREGIRSRREVSRTRSDLAPTSRETGASTQRTGTATGRFEGLSQNLRSTLISSSTTSSVPLSPIDETDDEPAPVSVRTRVPRQTDAPKPESEPIAARTETRTETTTATALAAVLRTSSPAPDVKPSPRSLAVLAALHGDFSYGVDEPSQRKEDTKQLRREDFKLRKDEPAQRKDDARFNRGPVTPRSGMAIPSPTAESRRDDAANSSRQLEAALPLLVSGEMLLGPDAAISSLTPAAGMLLGPALRKYAASAARVAEMEAPPAKGARTEVQTKAPRTEAPTPPAGTDFGMRGPGKIAAEPSASPTPATGIAVVTRATAPQKKSTLPPSSSTSTPTPRTGAPVVEAQPSSRLANARRSGEQGSREGSSGTPKSSVTVVEASPQPPLSRRLSPSVRVVPAEPLSTRTPASGMVFDKAQLGNDTYAQLSIPRSARTGFEPSGEASAQRSSERSSTDRRTPTSGLSEPTPAPTSVRSRSLQNRGALNFSAKSAADSLGMSAASTDRPPQSVRRPSTSASDDSTSGSSEFPTEQSRSRSRNSLIGAVDESEIVQVLGRESLIPSADRAPVSRRTWVPPKNLSSAPGTLTTASSPPPRAPLLSSLPPERGRKALLVASIVAVSWAFVLVFAPSIPPARSVRASVVIDVLTRNSVWKQVSGYLLVAVCLVGLVISLRKRWKRFQFADVPFFRAVHGVVTAAALVVFFAHTGFRVGDGLNFVLTVGFLAAMIVGAAAGAVFALSDRWSAVVARDRRLRASWVHILVLWPLPILVALHVLMVYYY